MANTLETRNPLSSLAAGEEITEADKVKIQDYNTLTPNSFAEKYGLAELESFRNQARANNQAAGDILAANSKGWIDTGADAARNVLAGAITGLTSTGAMASDLVGADSAAKLLSKATQDIQRGFDEWGSNAQKAQQRLYQYKQEALNNRLERQYQEDIKSGKSETEAMLAKQGRLYMGSIKNSLESGNFEQVAASGLGSIYTGGVVSGGLKLGLKGIGALAQKVAPEISKGVGAAYNSANPLVKKGIGALPWMTSMGLQEGGGTYAQTLMDGLSRNPEELAKHSEAFREAFARNIANGMSEVEAAEQAREEVALDAAHQAGVETGIAAGIANILTAGLAKPFSKAGRYVQGVKESTTEPVEETLTEGLGAIAQNRAAKEYFDENQDILENVGENAAQGTIGGLGIVGARTVPASVGSAVSGVAEAVTGTTAKGKELLAERSIKKNLSFLKENEDDFASLSEDPTNGVVKGSIASLQSMQDKLNPHKDSSGKTVNPSVAEAVQVLQEIQQQRTALTNESFKDSEVDKARKYVTSAFSVLDNMEQKAQNFITKTLQQQRASYTDSTVLSQEQIDNEGAYLAHLANQDKNKAVDSFNQLSPNIQNQLSNAQFSDPTVGSLLSSVIPAPQNPPQPPVPPTPGPQPGPKPIPPVPPQPGSGPQPGTGPGPNPPVPPQPGPTSGPQPQPGPTSGPQPGPVPQPQPGSTGGPQPPTPGSQPNPPTPPVPQPSSGAGPTPVPSNPPNGKNKFAPDTKDHGQTMATIPTLSGTFTIYEDGELTFEKDGVRYSLDDDYGNRFLQTATDADVAALGKEISDAIEAEQATNPLTEEQSQEKDGNASNSQEGNSGTEERQAPKYREDYAAQFNEPIDVLPEFDSSGKTELSSRNAGSGISIHTYEGSPFKIATIKINNKEFMLPGHDAFTYEIWEQVGLTPESEKEFFNRIYREAYYSSLPSKLDDTDRAAEDLNPEVLRRENKYYDPETGHIREYDSKETKEAFEKTFTKKFSKLFTPVKRTLHLWRAADAVKALTDLVSSPEKLTEYLRANKFTNAKALHDRLYLVGKDIDTQVDTNRFDDAKNVSLAQKIVSFLHPKSLFSTRFDEHIDNFDYSENLPEAFTEVFYRYGKPRPQFLQVAKIAALHALSITDAYKHQLNQEELDKFGIDPHIQEPDFQLTGAVADTINQSVADALRRFLGIAPNDNSPEVQEFLGTFALKVMGTLIDGGYVTVNKENFKVVENGNTVTRSITTYSVEESSRRIFNAKASVLLDLLDPTMRNSWHTEPQPIKGNINHMDTPVSGQMRKALKAANAMPAKINTFFLGAVAFLGGEAGISRFFNEESSVGSRNTQTGLNYLTNKGRNQTRTTAFNHIKEVVFGNKDKLDTVSIYYSNVALPNGRIMMEGDVTPQSSHFMRQATDFHSGNIDLTKPEMRQMWNVTLAQKLGVRVNDRVIESYESDINDAVKFIGDALKSRKYGEFLTKLVSTPTENILEDSTELTEEAEQNIQTLSNLQDEFNKKFPGLKLGSSFEGLNALVEMVRINQATTAGTLKSFDTRIYLETDGTNSGPANLNTNLAVAVSALTPEIIQRWIQTGTFPGLDISAQEVRSDPQARKELGTENKDLHEQTQKLIVENVFKRIAYLNKNNANHQTARLFVKSAANLFRLMHAVGWLSPSPGKSKGSILQAIDNLENYKDFDSDNLPFVIDREVAKILTTTIGYNAGVKSSTRNLIEFLHKELHKNLSDLLASNLSAQNFDVITQDVTDFRKAFRQGTVHVVDTETTGTDVDNDAVVQISVRTLKNGKEVSNKTYWIKNDSGRKIPEVVGGNPNPVLAEYKKQEEQGNLLNKEDVYDELATLFKDGVVIGHNIKGFDKQILIQHSQGVIGDFKAMDTLDLARKVLTMNSYKLDEYRKAKGFKATAHLADQDTLTTIELMKDIDKGIDSYKDSIRNGLRGEGKPTKLVNGTVPLSIVMNSLKELMSQRYDKQSNQFEKVNDISSLVKHATSDLPTPDQLSRGYLQRTTGRVYEYVTTKDGETRRQDTDDLRNFMITNTGITALTDVAFVLLGEPAHASVSESIGTAAMRASGIIGSIGNILSYLKISAQRLSRSTKSAGTKGKADKAMDSLSLVVNVPGGNKVSVEKRVFIGDEEPIYTDNKHDISYRVSSGNVTPAGVAMSPLYTQASGDGTMAMKLFMMNKDFGLTFANVFDGMYTQAQQGKKMGKAANEATHFAQTQLQFKALNKTIEEMGNFVKQMGWSKKAEPREALIEIFQRIASNQYLDGSKPTKEDVFTSDELDNFGRSILQLRDLLTGANKFKPEMDLEKSQFRERVINFSKRPYDARRKEIEDALSNLFGVMDAYVLNEQLYRKVLNRLPGTTHHMAATDGRYVQGSPLTLQEAISLREQINKKYGTNFQNYPQMLSAFIESMVQEEFEASRDQYSDALVKSWTELTNRTAAFGPANQLPTEALKELKEAFKLNEKSLNPLSFKRSTSTSFAKESLERAFKTLEGQMRSTVTKALLGRLFKLIPDDTRIEIAAHRSAFPADVEKLFTHSGMRGIYVGSKNTIYLIDQGNKLSLNQRDNAVTLAHEAIHAAISIKLNEYYTNPNKLTEEQRSSIQALDDLLDTLINDSSSADNLRNNPKVANLIDILKNLKGAERLDEALAYILTEKDVFEALSNYVPSNLTKHQTHFRVLLGKLAAKAKQVFNSILSIISGSALDKYIQESDKIEYTTNQLGNFFDLFGANTKVFLDTMPSTSPDPSGKNSINRDITRRMVELSKESFGVYEVDSKNPFKNYARAKGKQKAAVKAQGDLIKIIKTRRGFKDQYEQELTDFGKKAFEFARGYLRQPEEFAEAFVKLMLPNGMVLSSTGRRDLSVIYAQTAKQINRNTFLPSGSVSAKDRATANWLYGIFHSYVAKDLEKAVPSFSKEYETFVKPALFFALLQTHPEFEAKFKTIDLNPNNTSFDSILEDDSLDKLQDYFGDKLVQEQQQKYEGLTLNQALQNILEDSKLEQDPDTKDVFTWANSVFNSVQEGIFYTLALPFKLFKKKKIAEIIESIGFSPLGNYYDLTEFMRKHLNNISSPTAASYLKELYGRTLSSTPMEVLLKQVKGYYDKVRKDNLNELPRLFAEKFSEKPSRSVRRFLHKAVGRTGIYTFKFDDIKNLILNDELGKRINFLEGALEKIDPALSQRWIQKSKQLAQYLTGTRRSGKNLLTNADAIVRLLGEGNYARNEQAVGIVEQLITAYALDALKEDDKRQLKDLFRNETEGMRALHNHIVEIMEKEKSRNPEQWKKNAQNRIHGWLPAGNQPGGLYVLVPKSQEKKYQSQGFITLGKYEASSIDTSEPMVRMWNSNDQEYTFNEGLFQIIKQTVGGYQYTTLSRAEAIGTRILDTEVAKKIFDKYSSATDEDFPIPLYDEAGNVLGYERAIPPEDRDYIERKNDLFSGIAQYRVRQEREQLAHEINKQAIDIAYEDWINAPEDAKEGFVDLFASENPAIKAALSRMDTTTKKMIHTKFGDKFWVRKDSIWTYLGYEQMSATDMWDGTFMLPKVVQEKLVKIWDTIFFNGKGRYYMGMMEKLAMGAVTFARDTIVIRSGIVPAINALSNIFLLHLVLGMSPIQIYKYYKDTLHETSRYNTLVREIRELKFKASLDNADKVSLTKQIKNKETEIESLTIYPLILQGEYSTISAEGTQYEEVDIFKQKFDDWLNHHVSTLPGGDTVRKVTREALMLKGSESYKTATEFVNMGDWMAKVAGYRYLTEESSKRVLPEQARNIVSTLFVDYDQFVGREMNWTNKIGLTWFMTYKLRMIPASLLSIMLNPSRAIIGSLLVSGLTFTGMPLTENVIAKTLGGDIGNSFGWDMLFRGLTLFPIYTLTSLLL